MDSLKSVTGKIPGWLGLPSIAPAVIIVDILLYLGMQQHVTPEKLIVAVVLTQVGCVVGGLIFGASTKADKAPLTAAKNEQSS